MNLDNLTLYNKYYLGFVKSAYFNDRQTFTNDLVPYYMNKQAAAIYPYMYQYMAKQAAPLYIGSFQHRLALSRLAKMFGKGKAWAGRYIKPMYNGAKQYAEAVGDMWRDAGGFSGIRNNISGAAHGAYAKAVNSVRNYFGNRALGRGMLNATRNYTTGSGIPADALKNYKGMRPGMTQRQAVEEVLRGNGVNIGTLSPGEIRRLYRDPAALKEYIMSQRRKYGVSDYILNDRLANNNSANTWWMRQPTFNASVNLPRYKQKGLTYSDALNDVLRFNGLDPELVSRMSAHQRANLARGNNLQNYIIQQRKQRGINDSYLADMQAAMPDFANGTWWV